MSRSLHINLVKTKTVGSNKCLALMNYIKSIGSPAILTEADTGALRAIAASLHDHGGQSEDRDDIEQAIDLLCKHGNEFRLRRWPRLLRKGRAQAKVSVILPPLSD